jgi:integrase/recombinase XerD
MSPFSIEDLTKQFIKEKQFLDNLSEHTIRSYKLALKWFVTLNGDFNKIALNNFVIGLRESGMNTGGCNVKIRSVNSFLTWCFENEYNPDNLRIKKLKGEQVVIKTFSDAHIRTLASYKPKDLYQWRMHSIVMLLIDSGARIDEILSMKLNDINLEQLHINIRGKGNKERFVPISIEMRKIMHVYLTRKKIKCPGDLLFPTKNGTKIGYHNFLRDFKMHCKDLGIENVRISPHGLRHYFAQNYLRMGGDLYRLARILGHTNIATTSIYLRSMNIETIREAHQQFSPLARN